MNRLLILLVSLSLVSCQTNQSIRPIDGEGLAGTWLLVERGYSPGAGYIIDKISSSPKQTVTFTADGKIEAQGTELTRYQSFNQFQLDTTNQVVRIRYFPNSVSGYSEVISLSNNTLELRQPCIEGCHLGFIRIK